MQHSRTNGPNNFKSLVLIRRLASYGIVITSKQANIHSLHSDEEGWCGGLNECRSIPHEGSNGGRGYRVKLKHNPSLHLLTLSQKKKLTQMLENYKNSRNASFFQPIWHVRHYIITKNSWLYSFWLFLPSFSVFFFFCSLIHLGALKKYSPRRRAPSTWDGELRDAEWN